MMLQSYTVREGQLVKVRLNRVKEKLKFNQIVNNSLILCSN